MRLEPMGDKVIIKQLDADETTAGGILLPDAAREKPRQGRVLSVGVGRLLADGGRVPPQVSEGDRVVLAPFAGQGVQVGQEELLIVGEQDILAVIE